MLTPIRSIPGVISSPHHPHHRLRRAPYSCRYCGRPCRNARTLTCATCHSGKSDLTCSVCGDPICRQSTSGMCSECAWAARQERLNPSPTPEEIIVRAAEARTLPFDNRQSRRDLEPTGGYSADNDEDEKQFRAARRAAIAASLHEAEKRRYDIATLLAVGMEECFMPEGNWSWGQEEWRQRPGVGVDAEGFVTAYGASGGLGRLAG